MIVVTTVAGMVLWFEFWMRITFGNTKMFCPDQFFSVASHAVLSARRFWVHRKIGRDKIRTLDLSWPKK